MFRRCLNDFFGYCAGVPRFQDDEKYLHDPAGRNSEAIVYSCANQCILDPSTCGHHQTQSERHSLACQAR
ncbi:hypothetical protein ES703_88186 [subsurface metagenome]